MTRQIRAFLADPTTVGYSPGFMQKLGLHVAQVVSSRPQSTEADHAVQRLGEFAGKSRSACAKTLAHGAQAGLYYARGRTDWRAVLDGATEGTICTWCRLFSGRLAAHFLHSTDPEQALTLANHVRARIDELQQQFPELTPHLRCTRGTAYTVSGLAELHMPRYKNAIEFFISALADTSRPALPRSLACVTLPTEALRVTYHQNAFSNLAIALSKTGDPKAQELAEAQLPAVRNSYGQRDFVPRAKVWRLEGVLKAARHERTPTHLHNERRRLRSKANSALLKAFRGLLQHGTAVEAVDCALEIASLPWTKDPAADVRDRIAFSAELRTRLAELPPALHEQVVDFVAHAGSAAVGSVLLEVREAILEAGGMPLIVEWRSGA